MRLTISAGVAAWAADAGGSAELIARADAAQYRAKAAGRNRVVVWEPDVPAEAAAEAVS